VPEHNVQRRIAIDRRGLGKMARVRIENKKEAYQEKAEEIAQRRYRKRFGELSGIQKDVVYMMAVKLVREAEALGGKKKNE